MADRFVLTPMKAFLKPRKEFFVIDDTRQYKRVTVRLHAEGIVLRDEVYGSQLRTKKQQATKTGDLLVAEIDAKVGGVGIVPPELAGAIVSSHYFLYEIDETVCHPKYLEYFIRSGAVEEQFQEFVRGSTNYASIRAHHTLELQTPLPPLDEQRRIVARIEELAALIEEARELRHHAVEEVASFVSSLHLKLAQGRTVKLDEILQLDECRETVQPDGKYPQVGVKGSGQGLFAKAALDGTQTKYKAFNRLYQGAVVLSQPKGWEGAIAVCPPELAGRYASPEYRTFRCIPGRAMSEYLAVVFATPWFWTRLKNVSRGLGARRQRTRPEQFLKMELPMPIVDQQQHAIAIFNDLRELTAIQGATQVELDALLPSVLDQAFRGEL